MKSVSSSSENYLSGSLEKNDENVFEVEEIVDKKISRWKTVMYKVKWKNFGEDECTWELEKNLLNVKDLIANYEAK